METTLSSQAPSGEEPTRMDRFWARVKHYSKWTNDHLGTPAKLALFVLGSLFALDQLLFQANQSAITNTEGTLNSVADQLSSENPSIRASALRSIHEISQDRFLQSNEDNPYIPGSHLKSWIFGAQHQPFYERCRSLFIEYGRIKYDLEPLEYALVSNVYIKIAAQWHGDEPSNQRQSDMPNRPAFFYAIQSPNGHFANFDLSSVNFGPVNFEQCKFTGCTIQASGFDEASLEKVEFNGGSCEKTSFKDSTLTSASFTFIDLAEARFDRALLTNAKFIRANAPNASFTNGELRNAEFRGTDLTGADFSGADLTGVRFDQSVVANVDLSGANLDGTDFSRSLTFSPDLLKQAINADKAKIPNNN